MRAVCSAVWLGGLLLTGRIAASSSTLSSPPLPPPIQPDDGTVQTSEYQSDAARLLKVVGGALYHDKSAFLRELVSNAADALEKYRVLSLTEGLSSSLTVDPLNVTIRAIPEDGRLVITDSGIGMTRDELASNLGTIARSGTSEFLSKLSSTTTSAEQASGLIGRFGLGFYSSFLVANKVIVASKSYSSEEQYVFESSTSASDGQGSSYKIYKDARGNTLGSRGTEITLWLNDESKTYLDSTALEQIIQQHAEFATGDAPIFVWSATTSNSDSKSETADAKAEASDAVSDVETKSAWKRLNDQPPIWMRDPKSLTKAEYTGFYKSAFKDGVATDPLLYSHFKGDAGSTSFKGIIYLPGTFSPDFYSKSYQDLNSLRLYVRRVFITGDLGSNFLPKWLNWLKVVVDADDLPLNVGRDSLQNNIGISQIKRTITRKAIDMFTTSAKADPEQFNAKVWPVVGIALKLGTLEDSKNQAKLVKLLRFESTSSTGPSLSLDDYVAKRRKGQTQIYFIAGAGMDKKDLARSPFVETIQARGYEVLYFTEPIDEMIASQLRKYDGLTFQDVAKKGVKYGDDADNADVAEAAAQYKPLTDYLTTKLGESIKEVVISTQLTTSPCAILADQGAWTANMERLAAAQNSKAGGQQEDFMRMMMKTQKKVFQINPKHPLVEGLLDRISEFDDQDQALKDDDLSELVEILYDTSLVRSGFAVRDPSEYFGRIESVLRRSLGVSQAAKAKVNVQPAPEIEEGPVNHGDDAEEAGATADMPNWADWSDLKSKMPTPPEDLESQLHDEL